jgi:hypothetical protein
LASGSIGKYGRFWIRLAELRRADRLELAADRDREEAPLTSMNVRGYRWECGCGFTVKDDLSVSAARRMGRHLSDAHAV